jgi:hypothetical protein
MTLLDDILAGRHRLLEQTALTFNEDIERVLEALGYSLDRLLADFDRNGGRFLHSERNVRLASSMLPQLVRALDEAGYHDAAMRYAEQYAEVIRLVRATFQVQALPANFTTVSADVATAARTLHLDWFDTLGERAADEIRASIRQAVLFERDYTSFVSALRDQVVGTDARGSSLKRYANTHANTAIGQFDALVTGLQGEDAGVTHYVYWGPHDAITRPWCDHRLATNSPLTHDEINALAPSKSNTTGLDNFTARGGWNCRHLWQAATPEDHQKGTPS